MPAREEPVTVAAIEADIAERHAGSRLRRVRRRSLAAVAGMAAVGALAAAALSPGGGEDPDEPPPPVTRTSGAEAEEPIPGRTERGTITIPHYDRMP